MVWLGGVVAVLALAPPPALSFLPLTSTHQQRDNSTHAGEARLHTTTLCIVLALCPLVSII